MNPNRRRSQIDALITEQNLNTSIIRKESVAMIHAEDAVDDAKEAQIFLQGVARNVQEKAHHQIASIVTECLAAVFDDPYEFKILFEEKRGKTEARLVLSRPARRRLLVLDEPFRFVSRDYRPAVKMLLTKLAEDFGVQIIMTTHMEDLQVGGVIHV